MSAASPPALIHAAVISSDPDEVVRRALPDVERVLGAGGDLEVISDRRGVRAFRDRLPGIDLVAPAPQAEDGTTLVRRLARRRPGAVVGRLCADTARSEGSTEAVFAEDSLSMLLADVPLTLLCVYDPADPVGVAVARRTHPFLLEAEGRVVNPEHRRPQATSPVPAALLGLSAMTLSVPDGTALATLRDEVGRQGLLLGLGSDEVDDLVLAAHETVLLAAGARLGAERVSRDLPEGDHVVELRVSPGRVVVACRAPGPTVPTALTPRGRALHQLCDELTLHDDAGDRLVRAALRRR